MAIEEIGHYPEKMTEFDLHWQSVNAELGGTPETEFKLAGGYGRGQFIADKAAIVAKLSALQGVNNDLDFARADRDTLRNELRQRLILFRNAVKALLPGSRYERALPDTPAEQADQQKLLDAWDDAAHIWTQINTDQPTEVGGPLTLRGGYALAGFQTDLATMRTRYDAVKAAERAATDARGQRDELLRDALDRMAQYRQRLPLVLEPDDPLLASMPQLYPSPGSTPAAVIATGQYIETEQYARITWVDSTAPNVAQYELRYSSPPTYNTDTDIVIANIEPGIQQAITTHGLANPGDTALYKVYAILSTGNEAGSNTVSVTRP